MRGSIRKRGSTYTYWLDIGPDPVTGKRRQRTKGGFRTKRECQAALNEAISALRSGTLVQPSRRTVASFLVEEWLPAVRMAGLRNSTWASYRMNVEKHLVPGLGAIELQRLSPAQLNAFYRELLTEGRRNAADGLAPKTVYYIHSILHRALRDAVRWGYVVRNVADAADPPKAKTPEMRVWSPAQLRTFLDHVRGDRLYAAWLLAATTGMRRGEILGLRWNDLDLDAGRVAVRRPRILVDYQVQVSEPKTAKGRRSLALDPVTVAALRAHRARQAEEKLAVGGRYRDSELVFTRPDGIAVHPERFSVWFRQHVRAAGLPRIRLHDVRHSYATAALAAGVPAKVVSERLGHANIAITMDTYSHVLPGLDEQAAGQVARLILDAGDPVPGMVREQTVSIRPSAADKPARRNRKGAG
jgi:integrase